MRAYLAYPPRSVDDASALIAAERPRPVTGLGQVLLRVEACGVCHTDLHVIEGDLPPPADGRPVVPGHQVVGVVEGIGEGVDPSLLGQRVGVGWLGCTDQTCDFCLRGQENLCRAARFTGYDLHGGYAEAMVADAAFVYPLPQDVDVVHLAPLLCAGVVGYRALRLASVQRGDRLGLYGFGASAHLVLQVAVQHLGCEVLVFTRGEEHRRLALELGAVWAGSADVIDTPGGPLRASIIFAPSGALVPSALAALDWGGTLVLAGIHMNPVPSLPYELLWHERVVRSVANSTRQDARDLLALAARLPLRVEAERFPLDAAPDVLRRLKHGQLRAAAVLVPGS